MLELQTKTHSALELIDTLLRALEDRMTHLEAGQGQMISEARAAAGIAATGFASSIVSDVVTRITRLEMQQSAHRQLPHPS